MAYKQQHSPWQLRDINTWPDHETVWLQVTFLDDAEETELRCRVEVAGDVLNLLAELETVIKRQVAERLQLRLRDLYVSGFHDVEEFYPPGDE